ncbi:DUF47 domain-containing protein [Pseudodesulfovibrio indicus]|uniref:Phosphate transport regulator n=1 Tax=Pseudodesulfovibrio indicus TaxID=1716143 RepID=A0A140D934_9BACT|nr:DUF47 family protein [Pseudodesulfovibrio indicus]AMK09701.1 hypothetical protein AWY79_00550 [Pseudodesulfovibrio indicus]TDT86343.1 hypothetical protein EDC59_11317 [Pseudodesulfovibrio indicus]
MGINILRSSIKIERQIDEFLNEISEAGLIFKSGTESYLAGDAEGFRAKLDNITLREHRGDELRRTIETALYSKTLIPESRGDVLELLESMDYLLGGFKGALWRIEIESPEVPEPFHAAILELSDNVVKTAEAIVLSARAFFKDLSTTTNHMHKVSFWETECDKIVSRLQRDIFREPSLRLSHKMQLRDYVRGLDKIADKAEDVADKLAIYVIKRSL